MRGFRTRAFALLTSAIIGCGGQATDAGTGVAGSPGASGGSGGAAGAGGASGVGGVTGGSPSGGAAGVAGSGGSPSGGGAAGSAGTAPDAGRDASVLVDAIADRAVEDAANGFCSGDAPKVARDGVAIETAGIDTRYLPLDCCEGVDFIYRPVSDASASITLRIVAQFGGWPTGTFNAGETLDGTTRRVIATFVNGMSYDYAEGTITIRRGDGGVSVGYCLSASPDASTGRGLSAYALLTPISH
jgi:hypothetical protein